MKIKTLTLAVITSTLGLGQAKEPANDLEARKRSIPILEQRIEQRETQMTEIANDIIKLHRRLDGKLEKIVTQLSSIKDSPRSGYRVSKIKMATIEGLQKSVEGYQLQRRRVLERVRDGRSGIPKEILEGEARHFDEHTEKHIEQMLEISKSFTQDENVKKYEQIGSSYFYGSGYGWNDDLLQVSDEWRQNRRDKIMDKKQRGEVKEALKNAIARCESQISNLTSALKRQNLTKADRSLMESELYRHSRMLDTRRSQMNEIILVEKPNTIELNRNAALELEDALDDDARDMRRDLDAIFIRHYDLNRERSKVFKLKANLVARKEWLKKHEVDLKK